MIDYNIKSYVKVYENVFDPAFCSSVVANLQNESWAVHKFYNSKTGLYKSFDNDLSICYENSVGGKTIQTKLWDLLEQYIVKDLNFEWYTGWNGYSKIRFNKYDPNTEMREHCDHIHSLFDGGIKGIPTLSIVGALNSDYEGGEFVMWQDEVINLPTGAVMIFPSNFLYPHKITPVTKGTRYSYVSWAW